MDNHYHLIIETKEKPLQKIMQKVNNAYSKSYNKRHQRMDHVFGGRYKALLVNDDRYLLTLLRYIHTNPVRAGIQKSMAAYSWSSDCFYRQNTKKLVHIDKILDMFSKNRMVAINEYQRFMDCDDPTLNHKDIFETGLVIGEEDKQNDCHEGGSSNKETLDEILKRDVANDETFHLIKAGSRQRFLRDDKISYVKAALEQGYTFNEIGTNIAISATAANRMVIHSSQNFMEGSF
jgi:REP element-mobilizing transposase RayT